MVAGIQDAIEEVINQFHVLVRENEETRTVRSSDTHARDAIYPDCLSSSWQPARNLDCKPRLPHDRDFGKEK
jgi:hypothetical protein